LNLLQAKAGPTIYFAVYQRVRQQVTKTREERKTKEAILVSKTFHLVKKKKKKKKKR
jgi:U3 small nucleolar RNA-associated protein 20